MIPIILKYKKILIIAIAALVALVLVYTFFLDPGRNLKIDETENIVSKIRKIGEFTSMCFYEEVVIKESKADNFSTSRIGAAIKANGTDELVLIAKGKLNAGFDMAQIGDDDVRVSGDTLFVNLPEVKIFDIICNPSDIEVYVETGKWSHEQAVSAEIKAKEKIQKDALEMKILEKAETSGVEKIENLFKSFGFENVVITQP